DSIKDFRTRTLELQLLFIWGVDEGDMNDRSWLAFDGHQTCSAVWRGRVGAAFVTEDGNSGQYGPEGCGRQRHRGHLGLPAFSPAANAPLADALERNVAADAGPEQLLGQPNDATLRRRKGTSKAIMDRLGRDHGTPRISFTSTAQRANRPSNA